MGFKLNRLDEKSWIFAFSLLFASWVIYIQHGWVNVDFILYHEMAKQISVGNFAAAYEVEKFSWGFYPALIAIFHLSTGLSLQASANMLNVVLFVGLVSGLLQLVKTVGGGLREQLTAAFLFFGARYLVGDILPMLLRDIGYWAMMLWACNFLIKFYQDGLLRNALYWQLFAIIAMLFRIEGAVFLLALPVFGFFFRINVRSLKNRLLPYLLVAFISFVILILFTLKGVSVDYLGRIKELISGFNDIQTNFSQNLTQRVEIMQRQVIGEPFHEFAWFSFILAYLCIVTFKCLMVAGWAPLLLVITNPNKIKTSIEPTAYHFILLTMLLTWIIGILIAFKVNLLSTRYVALFGLMLIILSSFVLSDLFLRFKLKQQSFKENGLFYLTVIIVLVGFVGSVLPKKESYYYEINAVNYVKQIAKPEQKILYTTPRQRLYADAAYEGRTYDDWEYLKERIVDGRVSQFDYLLVHLDVADESISKENYLKENLANYSIIKTFYGHKNKKRVLVFKRQP